MKVLYFVEDRAHEGFIKTLVECIAESESLPRDSISHDVRSGRGGSRGIVELKEFFNDTVCYSPTEVDMLVTVIDGNCKGFAKRLKQVGAQVPPNHPLKDRIVYCIPDPHIERWYLVDQRAFKQGVRTEIVPCLPPSKCDQDYYKNLLYHALADAGIDSPLGGAEYAESIVNNMDLQLSRYTENSLKKAIEDIRFVIRGFIHSP